jgi:hypothetical protein
MLGLLDNKACRAANFISSAESAWDEVFPNSRCAVRSFLGCVSFSGRLAKDASECANRIIANDPLTYVGAYYPDEDKYHEDRIYLFVKPPEGSNLVYSSVRLRCGNIKQPTRAKLVKRFLKLRDFLRENAGNMKDLHFDISEKLGAA